MTKIFIIVITIMKMVNMNKVNIKKKKHSAKIVGITKISTNEYKWKLRKILFWDGGECIIVM